MIPFLDLAAQYRTIGPEIEEAALAVLRSGAYVLGPAVASFEDAFAAYCGVPHAVGVSSGTSALVLALKAVGVGPGDEVITVPATFVATVAAIEAAGARPVFVDIDPQTWTLDPAHLPVALTPRTRAIVPVHLHGRLADMPRIMAFARAHGLAVVEDAAQAHGAEIDGVRAGAFGDAGCFSFYPGKNLGACGEGGAVTTRDAGIAAHVRRLRDWGQAGKYNHVERGSNERLDAIQAAILSVKLRHIDDWTRARRDRAAFYGERLAGIPGITPPLAAGSDHVWHVYAVRAKARDRLRAALEARGIATGIHYPRPVHLQPAWADLRQGAGSFPESERLAGDTLSLPLWPEMRPEDAVAVVATLRELCEVAHDEAA